MPPDPVTTLDGALDELYGVDPSEFVATRKALVARLRADGRTDDARQLAAARRPTRAAWALNQLARRAPSVLDALVEAARDLQAAQADALARDRDRLREATRAYRAALVRAADVASAALGESPGESVRAQIADTLQAAATDEETAALLRHGRLTHDAAAPGGFGGPEVSAAPGGPERAMPRAAGARDRARDDRAVRRSSVQAELAAAETELASGRRALDDATRALEAANERVERLREELDAARDGAHAATEQVREMRRVVAQRSAVAERLHRAVERLASSEP
jgi:DNA repair exonuclease SbcCD ATPase subunit